MFPRPSFSPSLMSAALLAAHLAAHAQDTAPADPPAETPAAAEQRVEPPAAAAAPPTPALPAFPVIYSRVNVDRSSAKPEMDGLRIVHTSNTSANIAGQIALNVALSLIARGPALSFNAFGKGDLSGNAPDGAANTARLTNPALSLLPTELSRAGAQWLAGHPKGQGVTLAKPLWVTGAKWRLVYNSLDPADTTYKLHLDVGIHKDREAGSWIMPVRGGKACAYASEPRTLDAWKADDYQAVADMAQVAVGYCVREFVGQLGALLEME